MRSKKGSLLKLVLESYKSSCSMLAGLKDDSKDPLSSMTSALIKSSYSMNVSMFRNILMDADMSPDQAAEVEQALREVEQEHTNTEVLDSVRQIRAELCLLPS